MENIWIFVFLILFSYYYNFNHNYNIYNKEIENNNYQTNDFNLFPEYKYSVPLIYFLFIIQQ
jgi:hypothetical protein